MAASPQLCQTDGNGELRHYVNVPRGRSPQWDIRHWQLCCRIAIACTEYDLTSLKGIGQMVGVSHPTVRIRIDDLKCIGIDIEQNTDGRFIVRKFVPGYITAP